MEFLSDGQHRHGGEKMNCFFCTTQKNNCQLFRLGENPSHPPEYAALYNHRFVICPECHARGSEFLAQHLLHWIKVQEFLTDHGVGLPEIERHKKTGKLPMFNKRKKR